MTGNCFLESTPFFLQYTRASGGDVRNRKRAGKKNKTETEWEEWERRANFHNEKVIICGVRVSFCLVSVVCQLLARGHCEAALMHTNSFNKTSLAPPVLSQECQFHLLAYFSSFLYRHPQCSISSVPFPTSNSFSCAIHGPHMVIQNIQMNRIPSWDVTKGAFYNFI